MQDTEYMQRAISLAKQGVGWVSPNPLVGAVIVKDGKVIGEGYHVRCGEPHAERNALANCHEDPRGGTIYVTLEPCCHYGRTPPCTEAILEAGLSRVVVGSRDPNPLVAGKGLGILKDAGLDVCENVLTAECEALNEVFFHYIRTKRPFVVLKYAMTMDGKIATATGASKWITGEAARHRVHEDRHRYRGILVGVGTVLSDNPQLTCRIPEGRNPLRIVCDSNLRTPLNADLVRTASETPTLLATCCEDEVQLTPYRAAGCDILTLPRAEDGHLDLNALLTVLGERQMDSLLVEGGAMMNWSFLQNGLVQKVQCYLAPKLFGGATAKSPIGGIGVPFPENAFYLSSPRITPLGNDLLLESEVLPCSPES